MSTVDELINKERSGSKFIQDGSFKVKRYGWNVAYFLPYYKTKDKYWSGLDSDGDGASHKDIIDEYEIYEEPKPKVKHWLWTYREQVRFCSYKPTIGLSYSEQEEWTKIPGSEVEI